MEKIWEGNNLISIREHAYLYLKKLILEGEYQAGDRLVERELAAKLNISRTPIRRLCSGWNLKVSSKQFPEKGGHLQYFRG